MSERSADDVLSRKGTTISLGGEKFEVRPLVIKKHRKFMNRLLEEVRSLMVTDMSVNNMEAILGVVQGFMDSTLIELVGLGIPEFASKSQDWIEDNCTMAELQEALGVIIKVNFPWLTNFQSLLNLAIAGSQIGTKGTSTT